MADYAVLFADGFTVYATHGHHFNESSPPPLKKGDILLNGHTHVPVLHVREDFIFMNPGSVSIPKDGSCHSYMTLEDGNFFWKDVESGKSFMQFG